MRLGEMTKTRPVVIVNRRIHNRPGLVNVVPVSMTAPRTVEPWHVRVPRSAMPIGWRERGGERWAKCDMVATVSVERLMASTRRFDVPVAHVDAEKLSEIRSALGYLFELF